jgi:hypothetical protein
LTCSSPVWELVANVPAPGSDHRKNELPALLHQFLISARVVFADRFGHMGQVEFDRAMATRLEVEQQPVLRAENVPGCGSPWRSCSVARHLRTTRRRPSRTRSPKKLLRLLADLGMTPAARDRRTLGG